MKTKFYCVENNLPVVKGMYFHKFCTSKSMEKIGAKAKLSVSALIHEEIYEMNCSIIKVLNRIILFKANLLLRR